MAGIAQAPFGPEASRAPVYVLFDPDDLIGRNIISLIQHIRLLKRAACHSL